MTQRFEVRTSSDAELTGLGFDAIREPSGPTSQTNPRRYETSLFLTDTVSKSEVVKRLERELEGAEWATVEYRHELGEYDDAAHRDDPDYYHDCHSLRTPPTIRFVGAFDVEAAAQYCIGGESIKDEVTLTIPETEPGDYWGRHQIVGTESGIELDTDGVRLATVTVKEPLDRIPRSGIDVRTYPEGRDASETVVSIGTEPPSRGVAERLDALETASGVVGQGKRGVANRLDELEDRIESLENG